MCFNDWTFQESKKRKKKHKTKKGRGDTVNREFEKFSSGSEESDEDGPGSEESPDENELIVEKNDDLFKSDHEFSCESDVPETEAQIVKHARTVTKGGKRKRGRLSKDEKMDVDEESEEGIVNYFKSIDVYFPFQQRKQSQLFQRRLKIRTVSL